MATYTEQVVADVIKRINCMLYQIEYSQNVTIYKEFLHDMFFIREMLFSRCMYNDCTRVLHYEECIYHRLLRFDEYKHALNYIINCCHRALMIDRD